MLCKRLQKKTDHCEMGNIYAVAIAAFGSAEAKHVEAVKKRFAHRRLQRFAKAEEHVKRRCTMVTPGVKGEVECLLRQARGVCQHEWKCSVANLKGLLTYLDLTCSAPKVVRLFLVLSFFSNRR